MSDSFIEALTSGAFSLSAVGSIFSGDVSIDLRDSALFRREGDFVFNDNSTTIHITMGFPEAQRETAKPQQASPVAEVIARSADADGETKGWSDSPAPSRLNEADQQQPPRAPFTLKTTLVFDDRDIAEIAGFQFAGMRVVVVSEKIDQTAIPGYEPFHLKHNGESLALQPCNVWRKHRGGGEEGIPYLPTPGLVNTPRSENVGDLKSEDSRVLTLHRLPLGESIGLGGQDTVFAPEAIADVCVAVIQSERSGRTFASTPALLLLPNLK